MSFRGLGRRACSADRADTVVVTSLRGVRDDRCGLTKNNIGLEAYTPVKNF